MVSAQRAVRARLQLKFLINGVSIILNRWYIRVMIKQHHNQEKESVMAITSKLQLAADAVQDAKRRMQRAKDDADDDYEIRQAIKILDEAADYLRAAISELSK